MIDRTVFANQLARLALLYPNPDQLTAPKIDEYYRILSDRMTTAGFVEACDAVRFSEREFFPPPGAIIAATEQTAEIEAAAEWSGALRSSSWASNGIVSINRFEFSDRGRFAWDSLGGAARIGNADERELDFLRREFVKRYTQATPAAIESAGRRLASRSSGGPLPASTAIDRLMEGT